MKTPRIRVLHRDTAWLALDKPAGLPTTPAASRPTESLVARAKAIAREAPLHHPLSRLDADVTGVVLFALTHGAAFMATEARQAGAYRRSYVALLPCPPSPAAGEWTWAISIDARDATRRTTGAGADTREACTRYATMATASGVAVVVFSPVTGRTHQIRVHASAAGVPVLGDLAYGGARRMVMQDGSVVSAPRVLLHAWIAEIPGGPTIQAPVPADMMAAWEAAGGDAAVWLAEPERISGMTALAEVRL